MPRLSHHRANAVIKTARAVARIRNIVPPSIVPSAHQTAMDKTLQIASAYVGWFRHDLCAVFGPGFCLWSGRPSRRAALLMNGSSPTRGRPVRVCVSKSSTSAVAMPARALSEIDAAGIAAVRLVQHRAQAVIHMAGQEATGFKAFTSTPAAVVSWAA